MPFMKDDVISKGGLVDGIEISAGQYNELLEAKLLGTKVTVRNGAPFIYSMETKTVYRLTNNIVESMEMLADDDTPSGWQDTEPTPEPTDYTTASKLALLDYFDNAGSGASFLAVLKADDIRYERWLAAQNISIDDPMVEPVRVAMGWTPQQVQDLFNALNQ